MSEVAAGLLGGIVLVLAILGAVSILTGALAFSGIVQQCNERGYIQNSETRVFCVVEK